MARDRSPISILRPLLLTALAFLLALAIERFALPSTPFSLYAGNPSYKVVYSELKASESILWVADPVEPVEKRKALLTIQHQTGYGVVAALSPDGTKVAYGFLPVGRRDAFADGQLWVSAIDGVNPRLVSNRMDLHFAPVWSPDGRTLLFKTVEDPPDQGSLDQSAAGQKKPDQPLFDVTSKGSIVIASVESRTAPKTVLSMDDLNPYPIGWAPDGHAVYYYFFNSGGAEVGQADLETSETRSLGKLADGAIWNVKLSPDHRKILFVLAQRTESGDSGSVWLFDVDSRQVSSVSGQQEGPMGAAWHPSGMSITYNGSLGATADGRAVLDTPLGGGGSSPLRQESGSITSVPMSWSPDNIFLGVRRRSLASDGRVDNLALYNSQTGQMREIKGGYAEIVGWTNKAK